MDYFEKYFMKDEILNKNNFFKELMIFYFIYCHINQTPISYDIIHQFIAESLQKTFSRYQRNQTNKDLLLDIINNIAYCDEFNITKLDDYMEEETITYNLKDMFKKLKKESNNFSEKRLNLASIRRYYSFDLQEDINSIITDFRELISKFYLSNPKCIKAKNEFTDNYMRYNGLLDIDNNSIVNIKQFISFRTTFAKIFNSFLECYKNEKTFKYFFFEKISKNRQLIFEILKKYFIMININLNLFSFFLQEIFEICKILGINIKNVIGTFNFNADNILDWSFNNTYNSLFLKHIFKSEEDNILFIKSQFEKDSRKIDELIRLLILKTIVKYFRNITDIENFIEGIQNIRGINMYDYTNSSCLTDIKNALIIIYDKIISGDGDLALLYKGFLYLLMLYLLFINNIGIINITINPFKQLTDTDLYILKSIKKKKYDIVYELKMEEIKVIELFKVFFYISTIFKLVVTKSNYPDIISYQQKDITDKELEEKLKKERYIDVIKKLKLNEYNDIDFYLNNNVRSEEDIIKFLKLIKKYLPKMYDELLEYCKEIVLFKEIDIEITDDEISSFYQHSPPTSIVFTPNKITPRAPLKQAKPQVFFRSNRLNRVAPLPSQIVVI